MTGRSPLRTYFLAVTTAWILWETNPYPVDIWTPQGGYESLAACNEAADRINRKVDSDVKAGRVNELYRSYWKCFPDTFDPRGPVGNRPGQR
jgi:hypothetical protein